MTYPGPHNIRYIPPATTYPSATIPVGTIVLTLRGALPVEDLHRGDRLVTRSGAATVERVYAQSPENFTLEYGSHDAVYVLDERVCGTYKTKSN